MDRGIRASTAGIEAAKKALKLKGWTQDYLAGASQCSRQTLNRFLKGNAIEKRIFQAICTELELPWTQIAESEPQADQPPSLDELVETVRINIYDNVQTKCGSMRVLDMTQPIELNAIYTAVNILEKITGRRRLEIAELLETGGLENFERFSLSAVQEKRVSGLEAVTRHSKLMILGKPGAGKTTFLKYLAIQCIDGAFKKELVPLFITLKDLAEAPKQPTLLEYLIQLFKDYGIAPDTKIKTQLWTATSGDATPVELLLRQGRVLILLDGLDEVREADNHRVLKQIQDFANQFAKNPLVITCRIAAREYTFEQFTEVEVADFDNQQIATFTQQWFRAKNDPIKAENFIKKLEENKGIRELATSPLLLTLLCLVFEESGSFPANRSELYKEGLDVLLKKWDIKRNIERDQVYKQLSLKRKEDLLSQIALDTFRQGNYFFKQKDAERYITQYIRNLTQASPTEAELEHDSEAVLKSIEAQHGLFVERARGIYSFSHLTFHEYFTARKIVTRANADQLLQELVNHVTETRWREVFLLTVGMLENAETFLQGMKQQIDRTLAQDEKLQQFLTWVEQKSCSVGASDKSTIIRAFYLDFGFDQTHPIDHDLDHSSTLDLDRALTRAHDLTINSDLDYAHICNLNLDLALYRAYAYALINNFDFDDDIHPWDLDRALSRVSHCASRFIMSGNSNSELSQNLLRIRHGSCPPYHWEAYKQWWKTKGQAWTEQLRTVIIQHRNIGHDWQFTPSQLEILQQYYEANRLLVACLNSDCYVPREVREEIESTLLLPVHRTP